MIPVPTALRVRLRDLAERFASVAHFSRAPRAFIEDAERWLAHEPAPAQQKGWQLQLVRALSFPLKKPSTGDGSPIMSGILWHADGSPRTSKEILRALCLNVVTFAPEAPTIFHRPILFGIAAGHASNVVVQGSMAAGAWPTRAEGIFACGILWLLFHAAYQFSRILFVRPSE